jgi:SOS response regulatory protein OraA/RecX
MRPARSKPSSAYDAALVILGRRAYTTREMRLRLAQKRFPSEEIAETIERLTTSGLLNDATLLEHLAQRKAHALRGLDPLVRRRRLYAFLARRGYDSEAILGVLEDL